MPMPLSGDNGDFQALYRAGTCSGTHQFVEGVLIHIKISQLVIPGVNNQMVEAWLKAHAGTGVVI